MRTERSGRGRFTQNAFKKLMTMTVGDMTVNNNSNNSNNKKLAKLFAPAVLGAAMWSGTHPVLAQEDLTIAGGLTVVGQAISDDAYATNGSLVDETDPDGTGNGASIIYSVDVTFEKEIESGTFFLYLIGAEGDAVYDGVNADAEGSDFEAQLVGVAEAWYEHKMFDEMLAFRIGKIDPAGIYDGNEVANDQTTQFLADVFVNNAGIMLTPYTPGMNLSLELGEVMTASLGMFEDDGATLAGEFQNVFFIGEVGFHYDLFDNPGNFRLTGWNSEVNDRSGFAFNLDQGMFEEMAAIFMRLGFVGNVDEVVPETSTAFSFGGQVMLFDDHALGLAYSMQTPSADGWDTLSWFEAYVSFMVAEETFLSFDIQLVSNPEFDSTNDSIAVYGFRTQVNF